MATDRYELFKQMILDGSKTKEQKEKEKDDKRYEQFKVAVGYKSPAPAPSQQTYKPPVQTHERPVQTIKQANEIMAEKTSSYRSMYVQAMMQRQEEEKKKQEDTQLHLDTVNRLREQYMPVRPDPIPQVDITKKYGPQSELPKRGVAIASAGVSDAPFGIEKEAQTTQDAAQYTDNKTVVAAESEKQSIDDLTAQRDKLLEEIAILDTVLRHPVGRNDIEGQRNFTNAQAQRPLAEKALTDIENRIKEQNKAAQLDNMDTRQFRTLSADVGESDIPPKGTDEYLRYLSDQMGEGGPRTIGPNPIAELMQRQKFFQQTAHDPQALQFAKFTGEYDQMGRDDRLNFEKSAINAERVHLTERQSELENSYNEALAKLYSGTLSSAEYDEQDKIAGEWADKLNAIDAPNRLSMLDYMQGQVESTQRWNETKDKYVPYMAAAGFDRESRYDQSKLKGQTAQEYASQVNDPDYTYNYINNPELWEAKTYNNQIFQYENAHLQYMTDEERGIYNYLYKNQGPEAAKQMLDDMAEQLRARRSYEQEKETAQYAKNDPVGSFFAARGRNLQKAVIGPAQIAATLMGAGADDPMFDINRQVEAIDSTNAQELSKAFGGAKIPFLDADAGEVVYGILSSGADAAAAMGVGKLLLGSNAAIQGIMSSGAASSATKSALERGMEPWKAATMGVMGGLIEAVTEKYSIDALFNATDRRAWRFFLNNIFTEGSEELASSALNRITDGLLNADKSEIAQRAQEIARLNGIPLEQARKQARIEWMQQAGVEFISGAVMGGAFAAPMALSFARSNAKANKQIASKEAEVAKLESDALETAARERMDFETRDGEAAKKYSELVKLATDTLPAESATRALITEEGPIDTKRMEAVAKGALSEYSELLKANPSDEMARKTQALNKAIEALYVGIKTDRDTTVDKYTAGLDEAVKSEIKGKTGDEAVAYAKGYGIAHALGQMGVPLDTIAEATGFKDAKKAAEEGRAKWDIELPKAKAKAAELRKTLPLPGKGSVTYHSNVKQDALTTGQRDQIGLLEQVAKPMGYKFVMVEFEKDAAGNYVTDKGQIAPNGYFRDTDGTIYIDVNAGKTAGRMVEDTIIPQTAGHELTHYLKANAPDLFRAYGAAVIEELSAKGQDINALIAQKIGRAKQSSIGVEAAVEEVIADSSAMMLQNTQAVQKMAETNPGLFQKITEWVKDFIENIRKAFSKVEGTPEAKALMSMRDGVMKYADSLQKMWDDMAVSVAQARLDEKPAVVARRDVQATEEQAQNTENAPNQAASERYQERDSDDAPLTAEQIEYFKDSKVRDEQGRLLKVYHGSPNVFNVFNYKNLRTNGSTEGIGFYFTDDKNIASGYAEKGEGGKLYETYLSIKKPLSNAAKTITKPQLRKFLDAYNKYQSEKDGYMYYLSDWADYETEGYNIALMQAVNGEYSGSENDIDLISGIINVSGDPEGVYKVLRDTLGYDGAITKWKDGANIYVVFNANQIKEADNLTPTSSPDIRYQERDTQYLAAVESGDMDTAQKMVDEAAKAAGYTIKAYHGTPDGGFNIFEGFKNRFLIDDNINYDKSRSIADWFSSGVETPNMLYNVDNRDSVNGKQLYNVMLKLGNTLVVDAKGAAWNKILLSGDTLDGIRKYYPSFLNGKTMKSEPKTTFPTEEIARYAKRSGYNAVEIKNVSETGDTVNGPFETTYGVFNSNQVKSADPVTYDDAGNIIPLSQRFTDSNDIRYQERDLDYRTKRDILAGAFDSVAQTESEKRNLKEYKNMIGALNRMEEEARGLRQANTAERKKPERDKAVIEKNTKRIAEIEDRINNLDKRLLKMQNAAPLQNVLKREVDYYKKQQNALNKQQLEKYRAKRAETAIKQRYWADITKGVKSLNTMFVNESDKKHIPEGFKGAVVDFLRLFTDNTSVFDHKRLSVLKEMYDALETSDSDLAGMYDFDIAQDIADAARMLEGKSRSQLTESELESLRDIVAHFNHIVKNENLIFTQKRSVKTTDAAEEGLSEYGKKAKEMRLAILNGKNPIAAINKFLTSKNVKPVYFFKRVGGILQELFDDVRAGQGKWAFQMAKDRAFFRNTVNKYNYYKWIDDGQLTFTTARGDQITLTRDQALELYAIDKREKTNKQQGAEHLAIGGFVYNDAVKVKKKSALGVPMTYEVNVGENHPLTDSDLEQIGKWLTNEQRAFADEMVNYLSTDMGERGNEVSMAMYGIRKYTEKYYFPYKSASNYLYSHQGGAQDDSAIKHRSFTKRTTVSANNPVVLTGFTKVWADHVQNMNLYNAMAVPLDNFNRVYNYRIRGDKDSTKAQSVKAALEAAYGKEANAYIKQLLNDINGGIRPDKGDAEARKMMSLWKKGAVFASLSVVVQQPSAIGRALALVDAKYFRKGYTKAGYEEMMKWSGTANIKAMGRFDANMGMTAAGWLTQREYTGMDEKAKAFAKDGSFRDDVLSWLPQKADEMTWTALWEAVKRETASRHGNLIGSDAFMQKVAERFDEVVDYTQVYDSVLSRSEVMRSQSALAQMVTAFMAEPTTAYNMLLDSIANRKNKGMKNYVKPGRALGAFAVSVLLNSILKAMVTAGRDDDEKYTYLEKYLRKVSGSIADELNPLGLVPYGRDILSLWEGYDIERADMSLAGGLVDAVKKMGKADMPLMQKADTLAGAIGNALGIPYKNVRRDIQGIYNVLASSAPLATQSASGAKYSLLEGLPWFDASRAGYARRLYSAISNGDEQGEADLRAQMAKIVKKDTDINTELRKIITTEFEEERLEPRIALQQMIDLTELKEIKGKIGDWYKDGLIGQDVAEQLLVEFTKDDQPNERYKTIEGWNYSKNPDNEGESYSTYKAFYEAIDSGKDLRAVVNTYMNPNKYGASKSTLSGRITDNYKEQYIETYKRSKSEAAALKARLLNAYVLLGYDRDKKSKDIDAWLK